MMLSQLKINRQGQNFVEYLVMVTGVIVLLIFFLGPNGIFRGALERSLHLSVVDQIKDVTQNTTFNIEGRSYSNSF